MCLLHPFMRHSKKRYTNLIKYAKGERNGSSIYKAFDKITGTTVAIKRCPKKFYNQNEELILQNVQGRRLPQLIEIFSERKHINIVTTFIPGIDLYSHIDFFGPFDEFRTAELIRQIAHCVLECHAQNIIHLAVKPENLIWDRQKKLMSLIDFGSSTAWTLLPNIDAMDATNATSSNYSAPEIKNKTCHPTSDSWSIGVITFFLSNPIKSFYKRQSLK